MTMLERLKKFTHSTERLEEARFNRVWALGHDTLIATDGKHIAAVGRLPKDGAVADIGEEFPSFASEIREYLGRPHDYSAIFNRAQLVEWAGKYDAELAAEMDDDGDNGMRVATAWGFPFDVNRIAFALENLMQDVQVFEVFVMSDGEDEVNAAVSNTRCAIGIAGDGYRYILARTRNPPPKLNELVKIDGVFEAGDSAFDALDAALSKAP